VSSTHTLYKEWIYWYTSQSISAHALCLYAHISKSLSFWLYHVVTLHWDDLFALKLLKNILHTGNFMRRCSNFSCGPGWHSWYSISLLGLNPAVTKVFCFMYMCVCVCVCIYIYIYLFYIIYIKQYNRFMLSTCFYLYTNSLLEVWIRKCGTKSLS
jgi:hypothetical protein